MTMRHATVLLIALLLFSSLSADAPPATQPARVTLFAVIVTPGPAWKATEAAGSRLDLTRHQAYMSDLRDKGKVAMGGPFSDGTGGLIIYQTQTIEEAKTLLAADPAVVDGVFEARVHPWLVHARDVPR